MPAFALHLVVIVCRAGLQGCGQPWVFVWPVRCCDGQGGEIKGSGERSPGWASTQQQQVSCFWSQMEPFPTCTETYVAMRVSDILAVVITPTACPADSRPARRGQRGHLQRRRRRDAQPQSRNIRQVGVSTSSSRRVAGRRNPRIRRVWGGGLCTAGTSEGASSDNQSRAWTGRLIFNSRLCRRVDHVNVHFKLETLDSAVLNWQPFPLLQMAASCL